MVIRTKDSEGKTLSQIRRAKRERTKKRKKAVLIVMLMIGICIGILFTPLFNLREIDIEGNEKVDAKTIIDASGLALGNNIFKFRKGLFEFRFITIFFCFNKIENLPFSLV